GALRGPAGTPGPLPGKPPRDAEGRNATRRRGGAPTDRGKVAASPRGSRLELRVSAVVGARPTGAAALVFDGTPLAEVPLNRPVRCALVTTAGRHELAIHVKGADDKRFFLDLVRYGDYDLQLLTHPLRGFDDVEVTFVRE